MEVGNTEGLVGVVFSLISASYLKVFRPWHWDWGWRRPGAGKEKANIFLFSLPLLLEEKINELLRTQGS